MMGMDMKYEKQGWIVAIVETVFTGFVGIFTLVVTFGHYDPELLAYQDQHFPKVEPIGVGISFFVTLGLLALLWKAVIDKSYGPCAGWFMTNSVLAAFSIMFLEWPLCLYFLYLAYRVWSIHVIQSLGMEISINRGKGKNSTIS